MEDKVGRINELFVAVYHDITNVEEAAIKQGMFQDLSIKEIHTIEAIGMYGSKIMSELAQAMKVTMGTLTVTVDKLIQKGYLERQRSETDRRIVKVLLTKKGKLAYRFHEKFHRDMVKTVIKDFNDEEERLLLFVLGKLNDFIKEIPLPGFGGKEKETSY